MKTNFKILSDERIEELESQFMDNEKAVELIEKVRQLHKEILDLISADALELLDEYDETTTLLESQQFEHYYKNGFRDALMLLISN